MNRIKRVVVGVSGGVDSAVVTLFLKKRGFDVHGLFMRNWDIKDETGTCTADEDYKDASFVCEKLNVPLHSVNFVKQYWNEVFSDLIKDYETGYTPNPDILCNRHVKFNHFYHYATKHLNADAIATGHYANTSFGSYLEHFVPDEKVELLRATDIKKDQTFFLCQVEQGALQRTMFPLGLVLKQEVKQVARQNGLHKIAAKKESTGICFIGSRNFGEFIAEYVDNKPGNFVNVDDGKVVGQHNGIHQWTLGQRTKLGGVPNALFTARKDVATNTIYVASGTKHPLLHGRLCFTSEPHWIHSRPPELEAGNILQCEFKFQHTEPTINCEVCETNKGLIVNLQTETRCLTPGQYAVFYQNNKCLGSARIKYSGPTSYILYWLQNNIHNVSDTIDKSKMEISNNTDDDLPNYEGKQNNINDVKISCSTK